MTNQATPDVKRFIIPTTYSAERKEIIPVDKSIRATVEHVVSNRKMTSVNLFSPLGGPLEGQAVARGLGNELLINNVDVNRINSRYLLDLLFSEGKEQSLDYNQAEGSTLSPAIESDTFNPAVDSFYAVPFSIFFATAMNDDIEGYASDIEVVRFAQPGRLYTLRELNY